jgi:hypothetical protein
MTDDELARLFEKLGDETDATPPETDSADAEYARDAAVSAMLRAGAELPNQQPRSEPKASARASRAFFLTTAAFGAAALVLLTLRLGQQRTAAPPGATSAAAGDSAQAASPIALTQTTSAGVVVVHGHVAQRVPGFSLAPLEAADHVVTMAAGGAVVALQGDQALATLSASSELVVRPVAGTACEVTSGRAHFVVDKRSIATPFVVQAREVRVVVHGTTFDVSVDGAGEVRVHVEEGVVGVLAGDAGEVLLAAGRDWSSAPAPVPAPAASLASGAVSTPSPARSAAPDSPGPPAFDPDAKPPTTRGTSSAPRPDAPRESATSALAAQNELLRRAALARRTGDREQERKTLDDFAARYPDAPGLHDAVVATMRAAVARGDEKSARGAAARYLALFPTGPLRAEAAHVLR